MEPPPPPPPSPPTSRSAPPPDGSAEALEQRRAVVQQRRLLNPLYYASYLKVDTLLSLQQPKSAEAGMEAHDEMLFIVTHQACAWRRRPPRFPARRQMHLTPSALP